MSKIIFHRTSPRVLTLIGILVFIILLSLAGPFYKYNEIWKLVMNTVATIIIVIMITLAHNESTQSQIELHQKIDKLKEFQIVSIDPVPKENLTGRLETLEELTTAAALLNKPPESMSTDEIEIRDVLLEKIKSETNPP